MKKSRGDEVCEAKDDTNRNLYSQEVMLTEACVNKPIEEGC